MRECTWEQDTADCDCTYEPCSRKGICGKCLRCHWRLYELPACLFPDDVEKTYDRSVERFVDTYYKRGWS